MGYLIRHYEFQDKTILNRAIVTEFKVYRVLGESAHRLVLAHARSKLFMAKKSLTTGKIKSVRIFYFQDFTLTSLQ